MNLSSPPKVGLIRGKEHRKVLPTALAFSLKEGHKIVFHDLETGKVDALPLVGCTFVPIEDLQALDAPAPEAPPEPKEE